MISSDKGTVKLEGYASDLLSDLLCVVLALREKKIPIELIMMAVARGLETKPENDRLAEEFLTELMRQVKEKHEAREKHD